MSELEALRDAFRDIETNDQAEGLRITIAPCLSFRNPDVRFALRIARERTTSSGRPGKPTPIVILVNQPEETPADMLRTLADLVTQESAAHK